MSLPPNDRDGIQVLALGLRKHYYLNRGRSNYELIGVLLTIKQITQLV